MIQNQKIIKKLEEKTLGEPLLKDFITEILENESEGKQFTKFYTEKIKSYSKQFESLEENYEN